MGHEYIKRPSKKNYAWKHCAMRVFPESESHQSASAPIGLCYSPIQPLIIYYQLQRRPHFQIYFYHLKYLAALKERVNCQQNTL